MKQILISFGIMLTCTTIAFVYVKYHMDQDFAKLKAANKVGIDGSSQSQKKWDENGRLIMGGLNIDTDVSEQVGWQQIRNHVFKPPAMPT